MLRTTWLPSVTTSASAACQSAVAEPVPGASPASLSVRSLDGARRDLKLSQVSQTPGIGRLFLFVFDVKFAGHYALLPCGKAFSSRGFKRRASTIPSMTNISIGIMELSMRTPIRCPRGACVVPGQAGGRSRVVVAGAISMVATESMTSPVAGSTSLTVKTALLLVKRSEPSSSMKSPGSTVNLV